MPRGKRQWGEIISIHDGSDISDIQRSLLPIDSLWSQCTHLLRGWLHHSVIIIICFSNRLLGRAVDDWFWETTPPSGYSYARLLLYFLTQARIGHWRLQGPHGGRVCDSVSHVAELFINARILCHVGGGGVVQDQSQDDDDEGQQVKAWKLKTDKQTRELHIVSKEWFRTQHNDLFIPNRTL